MRALGIDIGSLTTKAVILNDNDILASAIITSGDEAELSAKAAREEAERCMRCDWPLVRESKVRKFFRTKNNSSGKISRLYTPDSRL